MALKISSKGNFDSTNGFLKRASNFVNEQKIIKIADHTVYELNKATPKGIESYWKYKLDFKSSDSFSLEFSSFNSDGSNMSSMYAINNGYISKSGKWVYGSHYIEKPLQDAYNEILKQTWEELTYGRRQR